MLEFSALASALLDLLVPTAHAVILEQIGGGMTAGMWGAICSVLPYCATGANAPIVFATRVTQFVLMLVGGVAVCAIVYAGIKMMIEQGNDSAVAEAKKIVLYAAAGLVLAIMASTIIGYFQNTVIPQITA